MHISQFLTLHGNIGMFTLQGLEIILPQYFSSMDITTRNRKPYCRFWKNGTGATDHQRKLKQQACKEKATIREHVIT